MRIERTEMESALAAFAQAGHGILIGSPGAGKTYTLQALTRRLVDENVLAFPISLEDIGDATEPDLKVALGYASATFEQALLEEVFPAATAGVVLIDGFDAARSAEVRHNVLRLIRVARAVAPPGWTVTVSVRAYDARRSADLLRDFQIASNPAPLAYRLPGVDSRHFFIPPLSIDEVFAAAETIEGLPAILASGDASPELVELLRVPFHLWLVEQLLKTDVDVRAIGTLRSEVDLLGRYWERYVRATPDDVLRLAALERITGMLVERRRLSVPRVEVAAAFGGEEVLAGLLSAEVLAESGPHGVRIGYSHNILFDYAVSVLAIDDDPGSVISFLEADTSRPLFLRPSLTYYFTRLWLNEREQYWRVFWPLLANETVAVRLVGRIIPPLVMARSARSAEDLMPLFFPPAGGDAPTAVLRAVQAAHFSDVHTSAVWVEFAARAATRAQTRFAWELGGLLAEAAERHAANRDQMELIASGARALFHWAWNQRDTGVGSSRWFDRLIAIQVLPVVLKTFDMNVEETRAIVAQIIGVIDEPNFELRFYFALSSAVGKWSKLAPDLALSLYRRAFGHEETSTSPTEIGGVVLRLVGNRRQDFRMVRYNLGQAFTEVFDTEPLSAAALVIELLNQESLNEHVRPHLREGQRVEDLEERFIFRERERVYLSDLSAIWWDRPYGHDELENIVDHVVAALANPDTATPPQAVLEALIAHTHAAVTWRVLLEIGAAAPAHFAALLYPLLTVPVIVVNGDTAQAAGHFAEVAAPLWNAQALREVEEAALALSPLVSPEESDDVSMRARTRARDRLLSRLPYGRLSDAGRALLEKARARSGGNAVDEEIGFSVLVRSVPEEEMLAAEGVDLSDEKNAAVRALSAELRELTGPWQNGTPSEENVSALARAVRDALPMLEPLTGIAEKYSSEDRSDENVHKATALQHPHPRLAYEGWTALANAAKVLARTRPTGGSPRFELTHEVLLHGAAFPGEARDNADDESYRWASWGSTPRTEAIQGLAYLADAAADTELARTVMEFARSTSPSERFLAVRYATVFASRVPEVFRQLVEDVAAHERNEVVLASLLEGLWYFVGLGQMNVREAGAVVSSIVEAHAGTDLESFVAIASRWIAYLALFGHDAWAHRMIEVAAMEGRYLRQKRGESLGASLLSSVLGHALPEPPSAERQRRGLQNASVESEQANEATHLAAVIVSASGSDAHTAQERLNERYRDIRPPEADEDLVRLLARHELVDTVAWRLTRAASGGFTADQFARVVPLLEAVVQFAAHSGAGRLTAPTTHHFIEFLRMAVDANPAGSIHYAAMFTAAGAPEGYQFDSLANDEVVRLVEHVLANHRSAVNSGQALADLLQLLDLFADQGWPQAMRLVWRLDEVYR
jgi:hypothetical protein